jgi:hypothetical protein
MKIRWKKVFYFVIFLGSLVGFKNVVGQNDSIVKDNKTEDKLSVFTLFGRVLDKKTNEPIPFSHVVIYSSNKNTGGSSCDFDGAYLISNIQHGYYNIAVSFVGYKALKINNFLIDKDMKLDIYLEQNNDRDSDIMCYVIIEYYKIPLIDKKNTTSGETIGGDDIQRKPGR